jgi:hypothetical protein
MASLTSNSNQLRTTRKATRNAPRSSVKVEWRPGSSGRGKSFAAQLLEISERGLRFIVPGPVSEDRVDISILGPSLPRPIKRFAKVVWSLALKDGAFCVGLEFQRYLSFAEFLQVAIHTEAIRKPVESKPEYEIVLTCRA